MGRARAEALLAAAEEAAARGRGTRRLARAAALADMYAGGFPPGPGPALRAAPAAAEALRRAAFAAPDPRWRAAQAAFMAARLRRARPGGARACARGRAAV